MNTLYEFICYEKVTEKNGEEETSKLVPHIFAIKKPTRSLREEAELYYGAKVSEGVKANLLTHQMINKRYLNDGGSQSEPEQEYERFLYTELLEKQTDFQRLSINKEKTEEEEKEFAQLKKDLSFIQVQIQRYEMSRSALYNNTAEQRAYEKTIVWWALQIAYKKELVKDAEDEKDKEYRYVPLFGDGSENQKLDRFDLIEEGDQNLVEAKALKRFLYLIGVWYNNRISKSEDFKTLEKNLLSQAKDNEEIRGFTVEIGMNPEDGQEPQS